MLTFKLNNKTTNIRQPKIKNHKITVIQYFSILYERPDRQ
jgi:hypothetical protein